VYVVSSELYSLPWPGNGTTYVGPVLTASRKAVESPVEKQPGGCREEDKTARKRFRFTCSTPNTNSEGGPGTWGGVWRCWFYCRRKGSDGTGQIVNKGASPRGGPAPHVPTAVCALGAARLRKDHFALRLVLLKSEFDECCPNTRPRRQVTGGGTTVGRTRGGNLYPSKEAFTDVCIS